MARAGGHRWSCYGFGNTGLDGEVVGRLSGTVAEAVQEGYSYLVDFSTVQLSPQQEEAWSRVKLHQPGWGRSDGSFVLFSIQGEAATGM